MKGLATPKELLDSSCLHSSMLAAGWLAGLLAVCLAVWLSGWLAACWLCISWFSLILIFFVHLVLWMLYNLGPRSEGTCGPYNNLCSIPAACSHRFIDAGGWLAGWLAGCLAGLLSGCLAGWPAGWLAGWLLPSCLAFIDLSMAFDIFL